MTELENNIFEYILSFGICGVSWNEIDKSFKRRRKNTIKINESVGNLINVGFVKFTKDLKLYVPDNIITESFQNHCIITSYVNQQKSEEIDISWPYRCIKPNACSRHNMCVYKSESAPCPHQDRNISEEIEQKIKKSVDICQS